MIIEFLLNFKHAAINIFIYPKKKSCEIGGECNLSIVQKDVSQLVSSRWPDTIRGSKIFCAIFENGYRRENLL